MLFSLVFMYRYLVPKKFHFDFHHHFKMGFQNSLRLIFHLRINQAQLSFFTSLIFKFFVFIVISIHLDYFFQLLSYQSLLCLIKFIDLIYPFQFIFQGLFQFHQHQIQVIFLAFENFSISIIRLPFHLISFFFLILFIL